MFLRVLSESRADGERKDKGERGRYFHVRIIAGRQKGVRGGIQMLEMRFDGCRRLAQQKRGLGGQM
jgi:hypothetical protein